MSFENKVVLVTGSGSGMGAATVTLFAKEGADVVIVDNSEERANSTADKCKPFSKRVLVIVADVSKDEDAKKLVKQTIDTFGKIDVLVNNAGIVKEGTIYDGTILNTYDEIMNTNLRSVVLMTSLAAPHLVKTKGCIVNVASVFSTEVRFGRPYPAYCLSKAGIETFTQLSALELAPSGVRVNAVKPGPVNTNILTHAGLPSNWNAFAEFTALKKYSEPEEIADLILYLASDKAKSVTGASYVIDNGMQLV